MFTVMLLFCRLSGVEKFSPNLSMENMDLGSNLAMMEDIEFEEKVDIDDLVLPAKPIKVVETEIHDIKQEPLEEKNQHAACESDHNVGKKLKVKMEENILKLCEELDKEKSENSPMDFCLRRSLKIRQFVEKIAQYGDYGPLEINQTKPFSCKLCDKLFHQVNEVEEHIKLHNSILEAGNLRDQVKSLKTQVGELEMKLKNYQKNELKTKAKMEVGQKITEPGFNLNQGKDITEQMKHLNQSKEKNDNCKKEKGKFTCCEETQNGRTCEKGCRCKNHLRKHNKTVHEGKKLSIRKYKCQILAKISCSQCPNTFANAYNLKKHVESVHEGRPNLLDIILFS